MKKVAILLLAILIFSCSDDDEKGTVENLSLIHISEPTRP